MITIRREQKIDKIKEIKQEIEIDIAKEVVFVMEDNDQIMGFGSYEKIDEKSAVLTNIEAFEGGFMVEDGIFRALLNDADLKGISWFFVKKECKKSFLQEIEFEDSIFDNSMLKLEIDISEYLYTKLPDFFQKPCKSCGKK